MLVSHRSVFHFANLFYMHLVSGECRPARVLYRLCRTWLKRCAGAAAKILSGKTQVTKQSALTITWLARWSGWM
jgi:hypothetical protein